MTDSITIQIPASLVAELRELLGPGPAWTAAAEEEEGTSVKLDRLPARGQVWLTADTFDVDVSTGFKAAEGYEDRLNMALAKAAALVMTTATADVIEADQGPPCLTKEEAIAVAIARTSADLYLKTLRRDHPGPNDEDRELIARSEHHVAVLKGLLDRTQKARVAEARRAGRRRT